MLRYYISMETNAIDIDGFALRLAISSLLWHFLILSFIELTKLHFTSFRFVNKVEILNYVNQDQLLQTMGGTVSYFIDDFNRLLHRKS